MRKLVTLGVLAAALWLAPVRLRRRLVRRTGETAADRPDVVTAQQIHAVVAVPSDARRHVRDGRRPRWRTTSRRSLTWWQGQDPTRIPRFDQAAFGASTCLDITFVRLPETAPRTRRRAPSGAFGAIVNELGATGNRYKDYLVYYDGPAVEPNVCGVGGTRAFDTGPGVRGRVWLQGCPACRTRHDRGARAAARARRCPARRPRTPAPATRATRATRRPTCCTRSRPASRCSARLCSTSTTTTTTVIRARGPTSRIRSGCTASTCRRSRSTSRSRAPGEITSDLPGVDCTARCTTQWDQGAARDAHRRPRPRRPLRPLDGLVHREGAVRAQARRRRRRRPRSSGRLRVPLKLSVDGQGEDRVHAERARRRFGGGKPLTLRAVPAEAGRFVALERRAARARKPTCRPATDFAVSRARRRSGGAEPVAQLGGRRRRRGPSSSPRSSPTVLERSASTSWRWIVSRLTCCECRKSVSASSG